MKYFSLPLIALFISIFLLSASFASAQVAFPIPNEEGFCGSSTYAPCNTNSECAPQGCSAQICGGADENLVTTCEYRTCYDAASYGETCGCFENKCQWSGDAQAPSTTPTPLPTVITSPTATPAPTNVPGLRIGDLNNDTAVDIRDLGVMLSNWGKSLPDDGDLNNDGRVNVQDLGILLSNWG